MENKKYGTVGPRFYFELIDKVDSQFHNWALQHWCYAYCHIDDVSDAIIEMMLESYTDYLDKVSGGR